VKTKSEVAYTYERFRGICYNERQPEVSIGLCACIVVSLLSDAAADSENSLYDGIVNLSLSGLRVGKVAQYSLRYHHLVGIIFMTDSRWCYCLICHFTA